MAARSVNFDGKRRVFEARAMVTHRSSRGCRRASRALRPNSGNSSRKRTPLCARVTSPGLGSEPPPTKETIDAL